MIGKEHDCQSPKLLQTPTQKRGCNEIGRSTIHQHDKTPIFIGSHQRGIKVAAIDMSFGTNYCCSQGIAGFGCYQLGENFHILKPSSCQSKLDRSFPFENVNGLQVSE